MESGERHPMYDAENNLESVVFDKHPELDTEILWEGPSTQRHGITLNVWEKKEEYKFEIIPTWGWYQLISITPEKNDSERIREILNEALGKEV